MLRFGVTFALATIMLAGQLQAAEKHEPRKSDPNAIRCVRMPVTGSIMASRKICMTNRDWQEQQEEARRMQSLNCSNRSTCAGS